MKIRHPVAIRLVAFVLSVVVRVWMLSIRVREHIADPLASPWRREPRHVFTFWHETLVMAAGQYARANVPVLVSQHRDGELIVQILRFLGGDAIRGSSTRGGDRALRGMLEQIEQSHLAITPDGPRGPRRVMQEGAVYIASRGQISVVPVGIAPRRAWRAKSWDRLILPKPFTRIEIVVGEAIAVPDDLSRDALEPFRLECERRLNAAQELAEAIAAGTAPAPQRT